MEIYKKEKDEYIYIGREWSGFPSNGVWLVEDGSQNLVEKLKDVPKMPKMLPNLSKFRNECAVYIVDNINGKSYSLNDCAVLASEFYAEKLSEKNYPELYL